MSNNDAVTNSLTRPMHANALKMSTAEMLECMSLDTVQAEAAKSTWPVCLQPVLTPVLPNKQPGRLCRPVHRWVHVSEL